MTGLIVRNAQLLDLEAGERRPGASIRIENDKIVEVGEDGRALTASGETPILDAEGRTLMPGLIDAHVHATMTSMDLAALARRQTSWIAIETKFVLEAMLRRGFTTVRDAGGLDAGILNALDRGLVNGPRVFRSGRVISQTGGHGDAWPVSENPQICGCAIRSSAFSHVADGPDAVRRAVREELKGGVHQIKIMASGGVASPSDPIDMVQYTEAEMRVAVEEARARHTYVLAHAYTPAAIDRAVRAGVRSIEHGNLIDGSTAQLMAQQGAYLVPTLVTYDQIGEFGASLNFPAASLRKLEEVLHSGLKSLEIAKGAGVQIGFGTDLLGETHSAQSKEFLLRSAVLRPLEILRSATVTNAALMMRPGKLGVLTPGAFADLLLVDGDPLNDISVLCGQGDRLDLIVRGGLIVKTRLS